MSIKYRLKNANICRLYSRGRSIRRVFKKPLLRTDMQTLNGDYAQAEKLWIFIMSRTLKVGDAPDLNLQLQPMGMRLYAPIVRWCRECAAAAEFLRSPRFCPHSVANWLQALVRMHSAAWNFFLFSPSRTNRAAERYPTRVDIKGDMRQNWCVSCCDREALNVA